VNNLRSDVLSRVRDTFDALDMDHAKVTDYFNKICKEVFRNTILEQEYRCDGRRMDQLRNISCEVLLQIFTLYRTLFYI